jgi:hypothetical protein
LSCLSHGRSSTATGYKLPELPPHIGRSSTATGYVPEATLSCPHRSLNSNRLCTSRYLEPLHTGRSSTATGYVPAGCPELPHAHKRTGHVPEQDYLSCSTRVAAQHSNRL